MGERKERVWLIVNFQGFFAFLFFGLTKDNYTFWRAVVLQKTLNVSESRYVRDTCWHLDTTDDSSLFTWTSFNNTCLHYMWIPKDVMSFDIITTFQHDITIVVLVFSLLLIHFSFSCREEGSTSDHYRFYKTRRSQHTTSASSSSYFQPQSTNSVQLGGSSYREDDEDTEGMYVEVRGKKHRKKEHIQHCGNSNDEAILLFSYSGSLFFSLLCADEEMVNISANNNNNNNNNQPESHSSITVEVETSQEKATK